MGVFSWFRSKPAAAEEAPAAGEAVTAPAPAAGASPQEPEVSEGAAETAAELEPAAPTAEVTAEVTADPVEDGAAVEGVEIPKQQSAEEAADSEAGEGARQ